MSDDDNHASSSQDESDEAPKMPGILEELKGDNPKICGIDYYNVIYGSAAALALVMFYLYIVVDDPELKQMVLIQGSLAIGLLCASMYFRSRLQARQVGIQLEKKRLADLA